MGGAVKERFFGVFHSLVILYIVFAQDSQPVYKGIFGISVFRNIIVIINLKNVLSRGLNIALVHRLTRRKIASNMFKALSTQGAKGFEE